MKNLKHNLALRVIKMIDAVMITIPFIIAWCLYYAQRVASPYYAKGNYLVIFLFLVLYIIYGRIYDGFVISLARISEMVYSQALAALFSDAILYVVAWLLTKYLPNALPLVAAFAAQVALAVAWSAWASNWYHAAYPPKRSAVIYDEREGLEKLINQYGLDKKFAVELTLNVQDCIENLDDLQGLDTVFLSGIHSHERNIILKYCVANDIMVYLIPRIGDVIMSGARPMHMFHLPMLRVGRYNPQPEYLFIKRAFDIFASGIALIVLSPVMLLTSLAIKATDGGPAFYKQVRLTKDGKFFYIHKFRSMRIDAEMDGVARLSTGEKDDRITPVGRFIRKVRLDELPQLWDIFIGNLSIVGPRPERPEIAAKYCEEMPEFALRLQAKAGLTGYAQVYGKYNTTPYDKLQMDLMYIAKPDLAEDLRLIFATIKILFMKDSTEGINEGATTAMEHGVVDALEPETDSEELVTK